MASEWKPIDTAPKDGTWVRLKRKGKEVIGRWSHPLDDWSLGPAAEGAETGVEQLLSWEPTEWAPSLFKDAAAIMGDVSVNDGRVTVFNNGNVVVRARQDLTEFIFERLVDHGDNDPDRGEALRERWGPDLDQDEVTSAALAASLTFTKLKIAMNKEPSDARSRKPSKNPRSGQ